MLNSSPAAVAARAAALSEIDFNPGGLAAVFGSVLTQLQARSNSLEGSVALGNCTNLVLLDLRVGCAAWWRGSSSSSVRVRLECQ